jgi:chromosome segregation ATPase
MPIDTTLVIQYLALALGVAGVALSLSYPQTLINRLRLALTTSEKKVEEVSQKVDAATTDMEGAIANMQKTDKNVGRTAAEIEELSASIKSVHKRIDGISRSLIAAEYTLRKNGKDLSSLTTTVQSIGHKLSTLNKSGNELESEISKLGKVTLWAEKNVKTLKDEVKQVRSIARHPNSRKRINGKGRRNTKHNGKHNTSHNGNHNGNGKLLYISGNGNGNANGNGKVAEKVLVKEKTI